MAKTRFLNVSTGKKIGISNYPNFHHTGSIKGMKALYYGKNALLVRCGSYIYNVSSNPDIYYLAK